MWLEKKKVDIIVNNNHERDEIMFNNIDELLEENIQGQLNGQQIQNDVSDMEDIDDIAEYLLYIKNMLDRKEKKIVQSLRKNERLKDNIKEIITKCLMYI